MTYVGVLGRGSSNTPEEVIVAGLKDSIDSASDRLMLPWYGRPIPKDLEVVYDWVLDNEVPFEMYAEDPDTVPKVFTSCEHGNVSVGVPMVRVSDRCKKVLYLWSDDDPSEELIWTLDSNEVVLILDLTNGLIPIEMDDEEESSIPTKPAEDYDEPSDNSLGGMETMTKEEMENMPAASVKAFASDKLGVPFSTKSAAIEALFPDDEVDPTDDTAAMRRFYYPHSANSAEALQTVTMAVSSEEVIEALFKAVEHLYDIVQALRSKQ